MIYFIGAGPGAEDLITIRGAKILSAADVIIYAGSLVNFDLVKKYARLEAKIYDSSKMNLKQISGIMIEAQNKNLNLARLHTGDPSIYGAISEQIKILRENNINFEIVPGVSSFCSAAASLKISYTIPEISQNILISRLSGRTINPENVKTEIYFLSSGNIKELCEKLINSGHSPNEKIALVYKSSWPDEKIICTEINELEKIADENNIKNHALIILGKCLEEFETRSKLYDENFSTGFREAVKIRPR